MGARMSAIAGMGWSLGVIIPAQNEAQSIERCIQSAITSFEECRQVEHLWIVVVADDCTDATADIARRALHRHGEVIECSARSPGTARRMGAARVLEHYHREPLDRLWLANTDADTFVPPDWLSLHLKYADEGETAVAGIVRLDTLTDMPTRVADLFRATYHIESDGSHGHVHGANFGVRADAYLDVGGWSHLTVAEDHCLWGRLKIAGWRLRASAQSVVLTSARLHGRACGGFADVLRAHLETCVD
jgi:cellulose synthase/poly-beta-1,6-N-acetylglucosamine synthase-like glycosyltransferase